MLRALVAGTRDPAVLADLAKGALRKKLPQLREALLGRFSAHHALLVGTILAKLDFLDEALAALSAEIEVAIRPFAAEVDLLRTIPGVDRRVAEGMVAEIGVDMTRFGAAGRLASWTGMCPGNHESAGKRARGTTRKGSKWLRSYMRQAAKAAGGSKGTYLAAQYARLRGRCGPAKATVAVGHSIIVAMYYMLERRQPYQDIGPDYFLRRPAREHHARRLARQLQALGYKVTLEPVEAAA